METKTMNKDTIIRRCLCTPTELHVREAAEGEAPSRTITGYAILFNVPSAPLWSDEDSEAREVIAPEAVTKELLDGQDIKMTMFHNRQLILARSNKGGGTLSYTVDEKGVAFEFDRRGLYASDLDSKVKYQAATIAAGIYTVNDWRKVENRPPIEGGDKVLVSANLRDIANETAVNNAPEPEPKKNKKDDKNKDGDQNNE